MDAHFLLVNVRLHALVDGFDSDRLSIDRGQHRPWREIRRVYIGVFHHRVRHLQPSDQRCVQLLSPLSAQVIDQRGSHALQVGIANLIAIGVVGRANFSLGRRNDFAVDFTVEKLFFCQSALLCFGCGEQRIDPRIQRPLPRFSYFFLAVLIESVKIHIGVVEDGGVDLGFDVCRGNG